MVVYLCFGIFGGILGSAAAVLAGMSLGGVLLSYSATGVALVCAAALWRVLRGRGASASDLAVRRVEWSPEL